MACPPTPNGRPPGGSPPSASVGERPGLEPSVHYQFELQQDQNLFGSYVLRLYWTTLRGARKPELNILHLGMWEAAYVREAKRALFRFQRWASEGALSARLVDPLTGGLHLFVDGVCLLFTRYLELPLDDLRPVVKGLCQVFGSGKVRPYEALPPLDVQVESAESVRAGSFRLVARRCGQRVFASKLLPRATCDQVYEGLSLALRKRRISLGVAKRGPVYDLYLLNGLNLLIHTSSSLPNVITRGSRIRELLLAPIDVHTKPTLTRFERRTPFDDS